MEFVGKNMYKREFISYIVSIIVLCIAFLFSLYFFGEYLFNYQYLIFTFISVILFILLIGMIIFTIKKYHAEEITDEKIPYYRKKSEFILQIFSNLIIIPFGIANFFWIKDPNYQLLLFLLFLF